MKTVLLLLASVPCFSAGANAQTNTAVTSGNIGNCNTYGWPAYIYNGTAASYTIGNGVQVSVNENRYGSAAVLGGGSALLMAGSYGISFTGSGPDTSCAPPAPASPAGMKFTCLSNRNQTYTTTNGVAVTATVTGATSAQPFGLEPYSGSAACGYSSCVNPDTPRLPPGESMIITFSRAVSNIRLKMSYDGTVAGSVTISTNGGTPQLSSCKGTPISGNTATGDGDVNIGGVWYTSITVTASGNTAGLAIGYERSVAR